MPPWLREIVIFALDTEAREGEILGLTMKSVDLFQRAVTIFQSKTGKYKTIPLTSRVFELLKSKAKVRHLHHDLVFPSENGSRITGSNLVRAFRNALKKKSKIFAFTISGTHLLRDSLKVESIFTLSRSI